MSSNIAESIKEKLAELQRFSATKVGVTRLPFTAEAIAAAEYLSECMKRAGLIVNMDASGAVHGLLPGRTAKRIVIGSHYDSVKCGGAFDGIAGVVCGIEIASLFQPGELYYSLEIIAFNDEEGVRFGDGFFSSKALLGELNLDKLHSTYDEDGISVYEAMVSAGFVPEKIADYVWKQEEIRCFYEIHIEQGAVLEQQGCELGIVDGIVGMRRYQIELKGQADHAGTTPMAMRHDALAAAAPMIMAAETAAWQRPGAVATVGYCQVEPNAVNTVADEVRLSLDIRSRSTAELDSMSNEIFTALNQAAAKRAVSCKIMPTLTVEPADMNELLQTYLRKSAADRGYKVMAVSSGAGHDALPIARKIPAAMVFVPSRGGRSHCPEEYSSADDLARAVVIVSDSIKMMNGEMKNELSK